GIKGSAQLFDELKGGVDAVLRVLHALGAIIPGANGCADAERIGKAVAKGVPINDGEAQMISHRFAFDNFLRVVMFESERVFGTRPFEADFGNTRKRSWHN